MYVTGTLPHTQCICAEFFLLTFTLNPWYASHLIKLSCNKARLFSVGSLTAPMGCVEMMELS